ncbi:putative nuclease HARBI1, partial [Mycetomoellerius zeteki]|uniref:putative nuclease HARBI1 n=1 Tax=Mycetomoellerius zeteki TaxID=64791 RepID=UPI00084EA3DA
IDLPNIPEVFLRNLEELEEAPIIRVPKRYIRDMQNPFEYYNDVEFKRRFRFNKDSILQGILPRIRESLTKINNRGLPVCPEFQLLICLRFYATASYQLVAADLLSLSQPTISRVVSKVSVLLAAEMFDVIKMPQTEQNKIENRQLFRLIGATGNINGLSGIDGAIDCTHIRLTNTRFHEVAEIYRNRKGYFSLNVQAVVGPRMEFLDIVPQWPGSQHDSRIFQNSRLYVRYNEHQLTGSLVGDSGYPCLPFLLTPIANPLTNAEQTYNIVQSKTRRIVERTFGVWKRRFPCLSRGLTNRLICCTSIIIACAVLHNLSLIYDN